MTNSHQLIHPLCSKARFNSREYVVTQPFAPEIQQSNVEEVLKAEYALLCLGHAFKSEFDKDITQNLVGSVPSTSHLAFFHYGCGVHLVKMSVEFYFNYEGSIFGKCVDSPWDGCYLPHIYFIATPLLPCGAADPLVEKYTGNGTLGPATDDMSKAIHAFVHWSLVVSDNTLLFCDLQGGLWHRVYLHPSSEESNEFITGSLDMKGVLCLIDPQGHTYVHSSRMSLTVSILKFTLAPKRKQRTKLESMCIGIKDSVPSKHSLPSTARFVRAIGYVAA